VFCAGAYRTWPGYLHQRAGATHAQDADGQWSRRCVDGGSRKRRGARAGRRQPVASTAGPEDDPCCVRRRRGRRPCQRRRLSQHATSLPAGTPAPFPPGPQLASCPCREDGGELKRCEDGGACTRCEDGGARQWRRNEQSDWAFLLRRRGARAGRRRPVESTV
jgi:hypothetical protein